MLDKDPRKRPTAVEILQDHFIKQHMEVKHITYIFSYQELESGVQRGISDLSSQS